MGCIFKCQHFWGDSLQLIFSLTLITLSAFLLLVSRTPTVIVSHKWSLDRTFFPCRLFLSVNHPGSGGRPMVITLRGLFRAKASCGMVKRTANATGWSKLIGIEAFEGQIKSEGIYEIINFPKNEPINLKDFCPIYYKNSQGRNPSNLWVHFLENWWFHKFILT